MRSAMEKQPKFIIVKQGIPTELSPYMEHYVFVMSIDYIDIYCRQASERESENIAR
jgi:hypothetical protein